MKRILMIGIVLSLIVLSGCGGISEDDFISKCCMAGCSKEAILFLENDKSQSIENLNVIKSTKIQCEDYCNNELIEIINR